MPNFRHGKNTTVLFKGFDMSPYFRSFTVRQQADVAETTAFKSTVKSFVAGVSDGELTLEGMFSGGVDEVDEEMNAIFGQETTDVVTIGPDSTMAEGNRVMGGPIYLATYGVRGGFAEMVSVNANFKASGGLMGGFSLSDPTRVHTATGATTPVGVGAANVFVPVDTGFPMVATGVTIGDIISNGGYGVLHVVDSTTAAGTFQVKIQTSTASGGTYTDLVSFTPTPINTENAEVIFIPAGTPMNQWARVAIVWQVPTTGTCKFHVNLARFTKDRKAV
jgi:hypothetical protein